MALKLGAYTACLHDRTLDEALDRCTQTFVRAVSWSRTTSLSASAAITAPASA